MTTSTEHFESQAARCAAMKVIPSDRPELREIAARYILGIPTADFNNDLALMANYLHVNGVNVSRLTEQFEIFLYN